MPVRCIDPIVRASAFVRAFRLTEKTPLFKSESKKPRWSTSRRSVLLYYLFVVFYSDSVFTIVSLFFFEEVLPIFGIRVIESILVFGLQGEGGEKKRKIRSPGHSEKAICIPFALCPLPPKACG